MGKKVRRAILILSAAAALTIAGVFLLYPISSVYSLASWLGISEELSLKPPLAPGLTWFDDYFAIEQIDEHTIAISEPRYWQRNTSYLIIGSKRAVLFDTGPGIWDITSVVGSLTDLPVTVIPSHLHYDHVAAIGKFDFVALLDRPELRAQVDEDGAFQFKEDQHLGHIERNEPPKFNVNRWIKSGTALELGERTLQVIATPGHTPDSLMLYDADRRQLFAGDFIYPGTLLAILPGAHLGQYMKSTQELMTLIDKDAAIFGAHGSREEPWKTPKLNYGDLVDLNEAFLQMKIGLSLERGFFPKKISVNPKIELWAPFSWNRNWQ